MTPLHPASAGSEVSVWFVGETPVRLLTGGSRFRVVGDPRCADINGERYWRVRVRGDDGSSATFDLRRDGDGWVLAGVGDDSVRTGSR